MKTRWMLCLCLPLLLAGCATTPPPDWDHRVGSFTHDQAVAELGAPTKTAVLGDGSREETWLIERGSPAMVGHGMGGAFATPGLAGSPVKREFPARPDRFLQLIFGPDGVLKAWKEDRRTAYPAY